MKRLTIIAIAALMAACTTRNREGHEYHNADITRMSLAQLTDVAKNTMCKDCRYDALYRLFHTYKRKGTLYTLYDFAKQFPHSEFADSALAIVMPQSDSLYAEAVRLNTIEAWSDFVVKVPVPLQRNALYTIDSLKWEAHKHMWDTDEKAWRQALQIDQLHSYERYLALYPNGSHAAQALKAKNAIEEYNWEQQHKQAIRQAAYDERQRQLNGDIRNVGMWGIVDSLITTYGYPTLYHYKSVGNSDIYLGEQYTHTYTVGKNKTLSEIKKIYLKDYYKLWQNTHFDILIQFRWKDQNIVVQHTTSNGKRPKTLMNDNGTITRLPSYKSVQELAFEYMKQNAKKY